MTLSDSWLRRWTAPRRSVLKAGLATMSLPLASQLHASLLDGAPAGPFARGLQPAPRLPGLALAVTDTRHPLTAPFGVALQQAGLTAHPIDGDVSALWFDTLAPRLALSAPTWAAGITAISPWLCLAQMAADFRAGARVRIDHRPLGHRIEHHLQAPEALLRPLAGVLAQSADWQAELARAFSACTPEALATPRAHCVVRSAHATALPLATPLVTWLLGPTRA